MHQTPSVQGGCIVSCQRLQGGQRLATPKVLPGVAAVPARSDRNHETFEIGHDLGMGIHWQDLRHVLIRAHDKYGALLAIYAAVVKMSTPLFISGQNAFS